MEGYIIGRCKGCGNIIAASVILADDKDRTDRDIIDFVKSGLKTEHINTTKPVGVDHCFCV